MTTITTPRYTVEHNGLAGTYHEQLGWRVIDATPHSVDFRIVASGDKRGMQKIARDLNAREITR